MDRDLLYNILLQSDINNINKLLSVSTMVQNIVTEPQFWWDKITNDKLPLITTTFTKDEYIKLKNIVDTVKIQLTKKEIIIKVNKLPLKLKQKERDETFITIHYFYPGIIL